MSRGLRQIGAALPAATKAALSRRGFAAARVIADWPSIVGPALAAMSRPLKIERARQEGEGATLVLRAPSSAAAELTHLGPLVLERINGHFGFRAVARLRILHGPIAPQARRPPPAPPAPPPELPGLADGELKDALAALGAVLASRRHQ